MKRNSTYILFGIFLTVLIIPLSSCQRNSRVVELSKEDNGKTYDMHRGDQLVIHLEGNPTTGYTWEADTLDESMLAIQGEGEFTSSSNALGSGGTMTFAFDLVGSGTTTLALKYSRPWEENVEAIDVFHVTLNIR